MDDQCSDGFCVGQPLDADRDNYVDILCGGTDCDDAHAEAHPDLFEAAPGELWCSDSLDNDCDGLVDADDPGCLPCTEDVDCDDNNACNGLERCVSNACIAGTLLACDDGLFCNGLETCDVITGCSAGIPPCPGSECQSCQEDLDSCYDPSGTPCSDDGLFCNGVEICDGSGACSSPGDPCGYIASCVESTDICEPLVCAVVDPASELRIDDNEFYYYDTMYRSHALDTDDEALARFKVRHVTYSVLEAQVAFMTFGATSSGLYSAHIYADNAGQRGAELAATSVQTVSGEWPSLYSFTFASAVTFLRGEAFWIGIKSAADENSYLPIYDDNITSLHDTGKLYRAATDTYHEVFDITPPSGHWGIRAEGCATGPSLEYVSHRSTPAPFVAGNTASLEISILNNGVADTFSTSAHLIGDTPSVVINVANDSFGLISVSQVQTASQFVAQAAASALGVYTLGLNVDDGTGLLSELPVLQYVHGNGCSTTDVILSVDNDEHLYDYCPRAATEFGNRFVIETTSFTLHQVEAWAYPFKNISDETYYVRIYAHAAGMPVLIYESDPILLSMHAMTLDRIDYILPEPMTFKQGNVIWVTFMFVNDQCYNGVHMSADSGGVTSVGVGVKYNSVRGRWVRPDGGDPRSMLLRLHGCEVP